MGRREDSLKRLAVRVHHAGFRARRRAAKDFGDIELWQLRSVRRAYSRERGPEVLMIGDSAMYWIGPHEQDNRQLAEMIGDQLPRGIRTMKVVGPGYNAQISTAYLSVMDRSRSRPRVVVLPITTHMATTVWQDHPEFTYDLAAEQMRSLTAGGKRWPRRLERPDQEFADAYDRRPAPSLGGAELTLGEMRMYIHAPAETPWQKAVRRRHRMDFYHAEKLTADTPGVLKIARLGDMLVRMQIPAVAYILPINHEVLASSLGAAARDHAARNAELVAQTFCRSSGEFGTVIDATFDSPKDDFIDPLHLGFRGRQQLAGRIAEAVRAELERVRSSPS